jgi:hypothetical protein
MCGHEECRCPDDIPPAYYYGWDWLPFAALAAAFLFFLIMGLIYGG